MDKGRNLIAETLDCVPTSIRTLAEHAGVSDELLRLIRDGERRLTPRVARAVARALGEWGETCRALAAELEAIAEAEEDA